MRPIDPKKNNFYAKGFVYPIATHWAVDKGGWLSQLGFDDFAFGAVVHALGGKPRYEMVRNARLIFTFFVIN